MAAPAQLAEIGANVTIYPTARILSPEHIAVASDVIIDDFVFIGAHERLLIGHHVHIASHASITGGGRCLVADFAGISSGARILTGSDDFAGGGLTGPTIPPELRHVTRAFVAIGAHALVGANAVVLPGVTIGEGAAVGAGAVVTADVEAWSIYAGVPARRIGARDREATLAAEAAYYERYGRPARSFRSLSEG